VVLLLADGKTIRPNLPFSGSFRVLTLAFGSMKSAAEMFHRKLDLENSFGWRISEKRNAGFAR